VPHAPPDSSTLRTFDFVNYNISILVNVILRLDDRYVSIWKGYDRKRSWPNFRYFSGIIQENHKTFGYKSCLPGRDLNPKHPEDVTNNDVSSTVAQKPNSLYITHHYTHTHTHTHTHPIGLLYKNDQLDPDVAKDTTHNKRTSMPFAGFEPAFPAFEQLQTYASDAQPSGSALRRLVSHYLFKLIG
jgi:hypothetical protein